MALGNQGDSVQGKVRLGNINLDALSAAGIQLNQLGPNPSLSSTLNTGAGNDTVLGEVSYFVPSAGNVVSATDLTLVGITLSGESKLLTGLGADRITGRVDLRLAPIQTDSNNLPLDGRISAITLGVGSLIDTTAATAKRTDDADSIVAELLGIVPNQLPPNSAPPSPSPNEARNIVGIFSTVTSSSDAASTIRMGAGADNLDAGVFGFAAAFDFDEATGKPNLDMTGQPNRDNLALGSVVYDLGADNDIVTGFGTGTFQGGAGTDTVRLFNLAKLFDQAPDMGTMTFATQTIYEWDFDTKTLTFAASNVDAALGSGRQFQPRVMKLIDFESIAAVGGNTIGLQAQDGFYAVTDNSIAFTDGAVG